MFLSEGSIWFPLFLQFILILVNALFASAEIAVISIKDSKLALLTKTGDKRAKRLSSLVEQPSRFLATIQVGITLAGFLGSAFAADNFAYRLVNWLMGLGVTISPATLNTIAVIIITLILSYITLIFGELVPKRVGMRNAERLSLSLSRFIYAISKFFSPIIWLLTRSTNAILRLLGIDPDADEEEVTEEEIRLMVDTGSEKGSINPNEKEMIHNIFEFDNKYAEDVMTHRTEVSLLWLDESVEQWAETIYKSMHTYYPICKESTDKVIGILNSKEYFRLKEKTRETILSKAVKPPYFVPESVRTDVLFYNMKKNRTHFAVVMDDYGGMNGIITINDLLEELVGDLDDDASLPIEPPIERIDSHTWKIKGITPIQDVAEELGVMLPLDEYDTFGGLVFGLLGSIPPDGSTPELEAFGLLIKVREIKEHRLERAIVYLQKE